MLTGVAIYGGPRITGPVPYAWVFVVVFLALIALIFFRVYGRGGQSRQAGHHSRRRNAHKSGHATAHTSGEAAAHTSGHGPGHTSEHGTTHSASHAPGQAEKHGHRAASRRRQHRQ
ncbi:MAG TPA: hypothetical protein VGG54_11180 [Trebonia sp.]